jgi:hypothetical protein
MLRERRKIIVEDENRFFEALTDANEANEEENESF